MHTFYLLKEINYWDFITLVPYIIFQDTHHVHGILVTETLFTHEFVKLN